MLLIESVERLLEKPTRDAFSDLLRLVSRDKTWRLLLTCRDYSADLVRSAFLENARIGHGVLSVPLLEDNELSLVESVYPALARPLANPSLRDVLRNPYFLDKALQIRWSEDRHGATGVATERVYCYEPRSHGNGGSGQVRSIETYTGRARG